MLRRLFLFACLLANSPTAHAQLPSDRPPGPPNNLQEKQLARPAIIEESHLTAPLEGTPSITPRNPAGGPDTSSAESHQASDVQNPYPESPSSGYIFVGNRFSRKYHRGGCEFATRMNAWNAILFRDTDSLKRSGHQPCNWCFPRWSKSVSSKLIPRKNGSPKDSKKH